MSETDEQRIAREKSEDEATAKAFMGDGPVYKREVPATPEEAQAERNKAAYIAKEAAAAMARAAQQDRVAEAGKFLDKADDERVKRVEGNRWTPGFITEWAIKKIRERQAGRGDEEKIAKAVALSDNNKQWEARRVQNEATGRGLPEVAKKLIEGAASPVVRQPTSFTRGDPEDTVRRAVKAVRKER